MTRSRTIPVPISLKNMSLENGKPGIIFGTLKFLAWWSVDLFLNYLRYLTNAYLNYKAICTIDK